MFNLHLTVERWKFNKKYDLYVSSEGRIKDKNKKLVEPKVNTTGYFIVAVGSGNKTVHSLVMETFVGDRANNNITVDHKNSNKRDNRLKNLEYVSKEENLCRATDKLILPTDGEKIVKILNDKNIFSFEQLNAVLQKKAVKEVIKNVRDGLTTIKTKTPEEWADIYLKYYKDSGVPDYDQFVNTIKIKAMKEGSYCGYKLSVDSDGFYVGHKKK